MANAAARRPAGSAQLEAPLTASAACLAQLGQLLELTPSASGARLTITTNMVLVPMTVTIGIVTGFLLARAVYDHNQVGEECAFDRHPRPG
jgi:hypothetical protein